MKTRIKEYLSLAEIGVDDADIIEQLSKNNSSEIVSKIITFVPIFAGRAIIGDLGVKYQDDYYVLNKDGDIIERGNINDDTIFFNELREYDFLEEDLKKNSLSFVRIQYIKRVCEWW